MLVSRANLVVVKVASKDAFERGLNGVKFEPDGSTVAGNGKVMVAVGPASPARAHFPERAADPKPIPAGLVMPVESVERAIRNLPKDKRTALQHAMLCKVTDPNKVGFTSVDAAGDTTTNASKPKEDGYPDWRATVRAVMGSGVRGDGPPKEPLRVCLNRSDLVDMLRTLGDACPDKGGSNPIFVEVSRDGRGLVVRAKNLDTGQHAIGAIAAYNTGDKWMEKDGWEGQVMGQPNIQKVVRRPVVKRRKPRRV